MGKGGGQWECDGMTYKMVGEVKQRYGNVQGVKEVYVWRRERGERE